jgi:hypothetical protein
MSLIFLRQRINKKIEEGANMNTWSVLWCCEKVFTSSQHYSTVIHKNNNQ